MANTPRLFPNGAVGFIDWLGVLAMVGVIEISGNEDYRANNKCRNDLLPIERSPDDPAEKSRDTCECRTEIDDR